MQFCNTLLILPDIGSHLLDCEPLRDVQVAVGTPRLDMKAEDSLWSGRVARIGDLLQQCRVVFDKLSGTPDLDAMAVRIVHQEHERFGVLA